MVWVGLVGCVLLLLQVSALQAAGDVEVQAIQDATYGRILADAQGRTLYLFTKDSKNSSTCYNQCAEIWPPLLVKDKAMAGKGVAANLLGTTQRKDGTLQVTYNGWPLYYYAKDSRPGDVNGQGVGGVWFLVSPDGFAVKPRQEQQSTSEAPKSVDAVLLAQLVQKGGSIFAESCAVCHGRGGEGAAGPALAGNKKLADGNFVARQILNGSRFMPPFDSTLSDEEVAAVATFIRNSWGNNYGVVLEEDVKTHR
ncbi:MAG: c-type cytochrome [Limnochordaceae bacterium]|nr:c-type cytochrome [Limnochordaceae bacterium]